MYEEHSRNFLPWQSCLLYSWVLFAILGFVTLLRKNPKLWSYLFLWLFVPYIALSFFSIVLYPRYLIFFATLFLIYASYFFSQLKVTKFVWVVILGFFITLLYFDYPILFNPPLLHFPPIDRGQYIEGGSAGWGLKEVVGFAREKAKEKRVILLAEGNFGMAGDALDVLLRSDDNIIVKGYWPLDYAQLKENQKELDTTLVYAVFVYRMDYPMDWPIRFVKRYDKPGGRSSIYLFELLK